MIKVLDSISSSAILTKYTDLELDIQWTDYGHKGKQCGLQFKLGEDAWTSAVGRSKGNETSYTELNPFFKGTVFEELITKYRLLRTRLMWVGPYACYSMHRDETPRVHIPLVTNPNCYFVFKDSAPQHLSVDSVYWTDTRKLHTFMNCSEQARLHLVGVVES
jgi:hypothetical protein